MSNYGPPLISKHTDKYWRFPILKYKRPTMDFSIYNLIKCLPSKVYGAEYYED